MFSLELARRAPVALAPEEHTAFAWLPWREAARKCFSWSNRDAILMIGAGLLAAGCATGDGRLAAHLESGPPAVRECAQLVPRRSTPRSTPRACATRSTPACRAFPTCA